VIDSHHHVWNRDDLPWLFGPEKPRIFGPYGPLRRDYTIEEYLDDICGTGIKASVYVQANWAVERFEDEVAWVQSIADRTGWPHAIVGYADMTVEDARPQLDRLARYPLMRGIRQQFHWHRNPAYSFAARSDLVRMPEVKRNIALLAEYGWSFDLQVFETQMTDAYKLVRACPEVTFILQHAGMLEDISAVGKSRWLKSMYPLAWLPNIVVKLSGLGTFIHRNDSIFIASVVHDTVAMFGADRCMFGSNFPIEKLWTGFSEMFDTYLKACGTLSSSDQNAIFDGTARRIYKLDT